MLKSARITIRKQVEKAAHEKGAMDELYSEDVSYCRRTQASKLG